MRTAAGDMPFLEHLEELRVRILRSLLAVMAGFGVGLLLVQRFGLVNRLKEPIAPFLPDGKLTVLSPTDPVMIVLKLAFITGLVLASPIIIWQTWAFFSPALYEREKKAMVPALFVGLALFLLGCLFAWLVVVPKALVVLLSFQADAFNTLITYEKYFAFVVQIVLAMGISAELPLLLILLTALGIVTPQLLSRFRRVAIVLALIAGAFLSPGGDIFTMGLMTVPLLLLYEVGIAGSVVVHRRRLRKEAMSAALVLFACLLPGPAAAQVPAARDTTARADTLRPGAATDTARARRLGLPTSPARSFGAADSVMRALLERPGFAATRYLADSAFLTTSDRLVRLQGRAMSERQGAILEAETISYREDACDFSAVGDPKLFEGGTVLVGDRIRYDTCVERGVVEGGFTSFKDAGADWFLRGNLGVDSASARRFAASSEITSCDLPLPHYHFAAKEVKWMTSSLMVARPAVLYIRDVPIAWIPFIFQETRPGRRSGILVPEFGFSDIVRPDPGYNRQVTNFGYYWAANDYVDVAARFDWYARRSTRWNVVTQYRWLDRFLQGSIDYAQQTENTGAQARSIRWNHRQQFGLTTSLSASLNLTSNSRVVNRNEIDPLITTQQLASDLNLQRRFAWGLMTLGGRRRQTLGDDQVNQEFPTFTLTPRSFDFGRAITWSPALAFRNSTATDARVLLLIPGEDAVDSVERTPRRRITTLDLQTPLRLGGFNWTNTVQLEDREAQLAGLDSVRIPDPDSPNPADSITVLRFLAGTYSSSFNWDTGINLPILFPTSWKLTPSVSIRNTTGGAYAIRNERTDGRWVTQGKRLQYGLSMSPTFFGFFGGIGPVARIRHSVSPSFTFSFSPETTIPEEYARATAPSPAAPLQLVSPATMRLSFRLSQNFEAKERTAEGDTVAARQARKYRLLSVNTSSIEYDFEQARQPGRTGWTTRTLTNSFQSDLVPGFDLSLTHDLWDGPVGTTGAKFDPFLAAVTAGFGLTGNTFRSIGALFGLGERPPAPDRPGPDDVPGTSVGDPRAAMRQRALRQTNMLTGPRRPFTANVNISISRVRPTELTEASTTSNVSFSTSFSPTRFWGVSWSTQYNVTTSEFEAHMVRLERDLHDWRAGFNFVRSPNGNFALFFSIHLVDLPDLKVDYNQRTYRR